MTNKIIEELETIQQDYLEILKRVVASSEKTFSRETIDEINIFWFKNRNIIILAGRYLFKDKDTFCFTGATNFDIDDREQDSFFLLGDHHVFDDPLASYINELSMFDEVSTSLQYEFMSQKIIETMKDNIKLIENYRNLLWVIPLRFVSELVYQHNDKLHGMTERLFCQLFDGIENLKEYRNKVVTVNDIEKYIDESKIANIILYDEDDVSNCWSDRIKGYRKENEEFVLSEYNDGTIFFLAVYGYFRQALAIIDISNNFEVIPFIRSRTPFNYFVFLSEMINCNLSEEQKNPRGAEIELKSVLSHLLYLEYRPISNFKKIRQKSIDINFSEKLYTESQVYYEEKKNFDIIELIRKYLNELLF